MFSDQAIPEAVGDGLPASLQIILLPWEVVCDQEVRAINDQARLRLCQELAMASFYVVCFC